MRLTDEAMSRMAASAEGADHQLISRIADGDREAMRLLYDRHGDRLFRFALMRLGRREDAQDAVQETMIAAWRTAGSYQGASSVSTWMFGICWNKVRDRLRRQEPARDPLDLAEGLMQPGPRPEGVALQQALARLDPAQQELVRMVFHLGLSQEEVAQVLEIPVGTVKSRTYHARRRLQELLGGDPT